MNKAHLIGRLTRDIELKQAGQTTVGNATLAVDTRRKVNGQWTKEANFFDLVFWDKTAEGLAQYLTKGKQIGVTAEIRQDRWEKDGQKRSTIRFHVQDVDLLGGSSGGSENLSSHVSQPKGPFDTVSAGGDIPF